MIWIVQILSIFFAAFLAKHDGPAVLKFEESGIDNIRMARFHRYNNWVKACFALVAGFPFFKTRDYGFHFLIAFIACGLWIYLLFDIALNACRHRSWDYLGRNDADGRRWLRWFGKNAGRWKAIILLTAIIITNLLFIIKF